LQSPTNMKKSNLMLIGLALLLPSMARAGVVGSPHDFSQASWNSRQGVCSPCHTAHNTDPNQLVPLWAHASSTATFTKYQSPTLQAGIGQPSGASLACLSCHDGTVAVNQGIGGQIGTSLVYIDPGAQIGPDLHTTHPISFVYDSALAAADGYLQDPSTYKIGDPIPNQPGVSPPVPATWSGTSLTGKTIDQSLLINHRMECSSCHDVHKQEGSAPTSGILVKISGTDASNRGSLICRTCHNK
jgi:hypothetical protein